MKVLVIGSGGREHAIAWKLAQSNAITHVFVAPGNAGTYREPKVTNVDIAALDFPALTEFVKLNQIQFTVVGPEAPLVAGIVDYFNERDLLCLGPTKKAAQLEGSKVFAKSFMRRHQIPTANAKVFTSKELAIEYLQLCTFPLVIKVDGLAGGKGVIIAEDAKHAENTIESIFSHHQFGEADQQVIIEEFIEGEEVSFIVLSDGMHYIPLATSQDHKRRDDADRGPNTGGMGAYSPAAVSPMLHQKILAQVIEPTLKGMALEGMPFKGFLYAGLMITPKEEIKVLEYNCRFGDPETQPILMRLKSDFADLCLAAITGKLNSFNAEWDDHCALGVVLAAKGYPDNVQKGELISTINDIPPNPNYKIFHAGTKIVDGRIVTDGGRVLCVTALGESIADAQAKAYRIVKQAAWESAFYRTDIGYKAIK